MKLSMIAAASVLALVCANPALAGTWEKTETGVVVKPDEGPAKEVRLNVMTDSIIQVLAVDDPAREQMPSLMTVATPQKGGFTTEEKGDTLILKAGKASAHVSLKTGLVTFHNAKGEAVLKGQNFNITPVEVEGQPYVATQARFNYGTTESFYGMGQHQNAQMDLNGEDIELRQHNMDIGIPFVISNQNYGVLWDNNSVTRWGNPTPYGLFSRDLDLRTPEGEKGLKASYYVDDKLVLTRIEDDIRYKYLSDVEKNWPKHPELTTEATQGKKVRVIWEGTMTSDITGRHKLRMDSSDYATLTVDGKVLFDRVWRMNWNGWYNNFEVDFEAGKPVPIKVDWEPAGGMIAIVHNNPQSKEETHSLSLTSEAGTGLNYYFISSDSMDGVIGGYRYLTGVAPMMPKWAYGFWQSRQRYVTQDETLGVLKTYRENRWPIDNIVQDWFYWPEDGWGSHEFDPARFPDPQALVDGVHAMNARIMISIWGKFYPNTKNYQELDAKGHMWRRNVELGFKDWVGPGYLNSHYSPYSEEAREIYYRQLKDGLVKYGFDAWWMDNTEPDVRSNTSPEEFAELITPTQMGPGAIVRNAYSLMNTQAMYDGLKRDQPNTRQFILTRSGFAGVQRNAAALWSGDVVGTWRNLYDQISAGVQTGLSGVPNWTHDIGGYAQETRFQGSEVGMLQENRGGGGTGTDEDIREWRELNLRWWQFGAFSPLFRSHGEGVKREIHEISPPDSEMRDSMVWYLKLRYRLMPYIYNEASKMHHEHGTLMRGLVMDFNHDPNVRDIKDQYMFGKAFLVAPVHVYQARSREVYFPAGAQWYDFYSGALIDGGKAHTVAAPVARMPLFVKAGSIVPMGPVIQYVDEKPDAPVTFVIYTGADGAISFYEDDGVTNGYEKGEFSRIPVSYNDTTGEVTIGERTGSWPGMLTQREFRVRFVTSGESTSDSLEDYDTRLVYDGKAVSVKRP